MASLGPTALATAVADRMRACGLTDPNDYAAVADARPEEFVALTEAVVVPESWFFRGGDLFTRLTFYTPYDVDRTVTQQIAEKIRAA